jgi:predicted anti-sigma-YlaC factor YlaD
MNTFVGCEQLDGFLLGDLPAGAAAAFGEHLASCAQCREAVDQQRWIDGLLGSPDCLSLEEPRGGLLAALATTIARQRRRQHRQRRWIAGTAAAAVLLVVVGEMRTFNRHEPRESESVVATEVSLAPAVFVGGDDTIAVPVASPDPSVTVVRVYPTYRPADVESFDAIGVPEPGTAISTEFKGGS